MAYRSRTPFRGIFYTPGFPPGVKWLLLSNTAVFILGFFAQLLRLDAPLSLLYLVPVEVVRNLMIWQLVSYMFLHAGFFHIIFNMLALWMFGTELEQTWGTKRFLQFYFFCGVGAGVCVVVLNYTLPWGNPGVPVLGSSGAIFGILMAWGVLFPNRQVLWSFLIPLQVKYLVLIYGAIAFLTAFQANTGVSAFAHLGGMLFGYLFLKKPRNLQLDVAGPASRWYRDWKLQRAKKKFQVYLRKQGSNRDPWIH